jgi:hypothetical protein
MRRPKAQRDAQAKRKSPKMRLPQLRHRGPGEGVQRPAKMFRPTAVMLAAETFADNNQSRPVLLGDELPLELKEYRGSNIEQRGGAMASGALVAELDKQADGKEQPIASWSCRKISDCCT